VFAQQVQPFGTGHHLEVSLESRAQVVFARAAASLAGSSPGADVIVSGDAHLLDLKRFHGIDIIAPADALRRFGI
jgi:hypothetical protein